MLKLKLFVMELFKFLPVFLEEFLIAIILFIPEQLLEISFIQISSLRLVHCMMLLLLGSIIFVIV